MGLGLAIMVLFLGGMSTDLWHVLSEARTLDAAADSAAGASGVDVAVYQNGDGPVLDLATQLAQSNLARQPNLPGNTNAQIDVTPANIP